MQTARETSYEALRIILEHVSSGAPVSARDLAIRELEAFRFDPKSRDVELLNVALKAALHNWGCSWGLNPPVSRSARVM